MLLIDYLNCRGQLPADAEFNFLDHAKRIDMYGVELHKARVIIFSLKWLSLLIKNYLFRIIRIEIFK